MSSTGKKVYVGLSGGVDSSVTAAILKDEGYDVTGVFMKNWTKSLPGFKCPWEQDLRDAKRVAVQLGIPFIVFDFEAEYFDKVVQYMIDGFESGLTPNPDIMCNQEIKFKLFYELAMEQGADMIATGHYARVDNNDPGLLAALDESKDQTYFLYRIPSDALRKTLFPLGDMLKSDVRKKAQELGLITATKKDSVGICFVGQIGIKDFLKNYVDYESGLIIDQHGKQIGKHEGAIFYTIGQRQGLDVGGGMPFYVTGKDMSENIVYVSSNIDDGKLWSKTVSLGSVYWISDSAKLGKTYQARHRHLGGLHRVRIIKQDADTATIEFNNQIRAITPGQSVVIYDEDVCIGGGVVT